MTVNLRALIVSGILAASALSLSQPKPQDAERLLADVIRANEGLKCRGLRIVTFTSVHDGKPYMRKLTESIVRDGARSRTEYSGDDDMTGEIAVDDGEFRLQYKPKENVIYRMPSFLSESSERLGALLMKKDRPLNLRVSEGGTVASLPTMLLEVEGGPGFVHRIWIEKKGKAILKREFKGPREDRGMSYEFQTFSYVRQVDPSEFVINKPGARIVGPEERLAILARQVKFEPARLYPNTGFALFDVRVFEKGEGAFLRSSYGNGRQVLTLIQARGELSRERFGRRGEARIQVFTWDAAGYRFALIGEFPLPELERISMLVRK